MGAHQPLQLHHQSTSNTSGYFLPRAACIWLASGFLSLALLHLLFCSPPVAQDAVFSPLRQYVNSTYSFISSGVGGGGGGVQSCDYSEGRWEWSPGYGRRYNGTACDVKEEQDCLRNGRPDTGYLDWRWQPAGCRLRGFDAAAFLSAVRGKHVAFVGDSMARNQVESLVCLLGASFPHRFVYRSADVHNRKFMRWAFPSHDVTMSVYWAPFLVRSTGKMENYSMPYNNVHLDALAERWVADADTMDVAVLTAGHWFWNSAVYYNGSEVIGVHGYPDLNHTDIGFVSPYREAYRMSVERLLLSSGRRRPRTVVLGTFAPPHFEGKEMNDPTACAKTTPYMSSEKELGGIEREMRSVIHEVAAVASGGKVRVEVLDVTKLASLRPDGHPGPYMNRDPFAHGAGPQDRMQTDCLHSCLPGPIDTFNEILLHILTTTRR